MTHLRKMMLEELERRNYAQTTRDCYIQTIEDFARYFKRPPDQLGPEHIRHYQAYLFRERKLAAHTVTQRLAGLRFFFIQTMKKPWSVADTPYPKKARHLPSLLSSEEVALLIDSARTRFHRIVLMTLYGTGVRRAELTRLQIPPPSAPISMSAPAVDIAPPSPTTAAETGIARSVRAVPANTGSKHGAANFSPRPTPMSYSLYLSSWRAPGFAEQKDHL